MGGIRIFRLFKTLIFLYFSSLSCPWTGAPGMSDRARSWIKSAGEISEICSKPKNTWDPPSDDLVDLPGKEISQNS
jgi:hypothetical protein